MKHKATFFDDEQSPERFHVEMTVQEMALLYALIGHIAPQAVTDASNVEWGNVLYDFADAVSSIGNVYFVAGWREIAPALHPIALRAGLAVEEHPT